MEYGLCGRVKNRGIHLKNFVCKNVVTLTERKLTK